MEASYKELQGEEKDQEYLDTRARKITLPVETGKKVRTVAAVIYHMICCKVDTIYAGNGNLHCEGKRRRSSDDIYLVAKNYKPSVTLTQVKKALADLVVAGLVYNNYCPIINKTVHMNRNVKQPSLSDIKKIVKI